MITEDRMKKMIKHVKNLADYYLFIHYKKNILKQLQIMQINL